jgi:hypothetical protein
MHVNISDPLKTGMHFELSVSKIGYMTLGTVPVKGLLLAVFRKGAKAR